ncbi:peptidogalycan biosysnthesis protein [Cupriavidus basilensis]
MENYRTQIVFDLSELPAATWDALVAAQPGATPRSCATPSCTLLHASGSACDETGWSPRYLTLWAPHEGGGERLVAAMPLYAKSHSYGEYVFDWAWADASCAAPPSLLPKAAVRDPLHARPGREAAGRGRGRAP